MIDPSELEAKKALLAELEEKHGPNDGAVVELRAEIQEAETAPEPTEDPVADSVGEAQDAEAETRD